MGAELDRLENGSCQVDLRTNDDSIVSPVGEYRENNAGTARRDAFDRATGLAENKARNMRAVAGGRTIGCGRSDECSLTIEVSALQRRMTSIHRAIEESDADVGLTPRFRPNCVQFWKARRPFNIPEGACISRTR